MKIFAVIDTNVIVSALLAKTIDTPPAQVLMHLLNGDFVPVFSSDIILEYLQVLKRKHKHFPQSPIVVSPKEFLTLFQ